VECDGENGHGGTLQHSSGIRKSTLFKIFDSFSHLIAVNCLSFLFNLAYARCRKAINEKKMFEASLNKNVKMY